MSPLIPIGAMAIFAGVIAAVFILASVFLGPRKRNPVKDMPFETGMESEGFKRGKVPVRFYLMAILFVVFDVELAFLFPWAVVYRSLGLFGFLEMLIFFFVVGAGFVYAWKIGALEWE